MKNSTDIKVHNNKVMINDEVIYDFEDRYHNISALSVEQQIKIFSGLINTISTTQLSKAEKNEFILICTYLFQILSAKNTPAAILIIGDNLFLNIIAKIMNLFSNANKLYHVCDINNYHSNGLCSNLISIVVNQFCSTDFLADYRFDAVFVDLNFIKNNLHAVLSECRRLLGRDGKIICYGSSAFSSEMQNVLLNADANLYQLGPERMVGSISINNEQDNVSQNSVKEEILNIIEQKNSRLFELLQYIMSNRPISLSDIWYSIIDDCIYMIDQIESIITKNYMLFENKDLKYQTNEMKNALLDFKYEAYLNRKHYDFFQANLFDCYNDWITNIK